MQGLAPCKGEQTLKDDCPTAGAACPACTTDDECIIVDPVASQATVLNSLGARIWSLIDGKRTVSDIVGEIVSEYDVTHAVAEGDAREFFESLFERKLAQF